MEWLEGSTDSIDMNLSKLQDVVRDTEAWHTAVRGVTQSRTQLGNSTTTTMNFRISCPNFVENVIAI